MASVAQIYAFFLLFSTFSLIPFPFSFCPLTSTKGYVRNYKLFLQNKANFQKVKLNVNKVLTKDYYKMDTWSIGKNEPKTNPKRTQTNPIKANKMPQRTQYEPKQTQFYNLVCLQSPILPAHLLINRMSQICCVCSFSVSFDSAKMALYTGNWNVNKDGRKKLNLLKYKRLNGPGRLRVLTGTLFAHSYLQNFLYTDDTQ